MKVSECRKCRYFRERRWSQRYEPKDYHPIGMTHVYGWCAYRKSRCRQVKRRECTPNQIGFFCGDGVNMAK